MPMTLGEVFTRILEFDDELTIFAVGGPTASPASMAIVCTEDEDGSTVCPVEDSCSYVIEVDIAKEAIEVWSDWRNGNEPTPSQAFEAVMYYAANDAYLPD
jgi:hypothetical protein